MILKIFDEEFLRMRVGEVGCVVDYLDHKSTNVVAVRDRNDATLALLPSFIASIKRVQASIWTSSLQLQYRKGHIHAQKHVYFFELRGTSTETELRRLAFRLIMRSAQD
jgi:hypothetical protein